MRQYLMVKHQGRINTTPNHFPETKLVEANSPQEALQYEDHGDYWCIDVTSKPQTYIVRQGMNSVSWK